MNLIEHTTRDLFEKNQVQCVSRLQFYGVAIAGKIWTEEKDSIIRNQYNAKELALGFFSADEALIRGLLDQMLKDYPELVEQWIRKQL